MAEELDAHRKRAQQQHRLGLTDIYNVLEKVRAGTALTAKDKAVHDAALVSTLRQLHDDLDRAVADAYGWPWPLSDAEILDRVVALNAARAAEEAQGRIRWLRPDYQLAAVGAPTSARQAALALADPSDPSALPSAQQPMAHRPSPIARRKAKAPWPKTLPERAKAIGAALAAADSPQTAEQLAQCFLRAKPADVREILETLAALGQAHESDTPGAYLR